EVPIGILNLEKRIVGLRNDTARYRVQQSAVHGAGPGIRSLALSLILSAPGSVDQLIIRKPADLSRPAVLNGGLGQIAVGLEGVFVLGLGTGIDVDQNCVFEPRQIVRGRQSVVLLPGVRVEKRKADTIPLRRERLG